MALTLRPFQAELITKVRQSFVSGKKAPLIVAPCGAGKTVLFSYLTEAIVKKGNRVLLLAHRAELIDQISNTLNQFGVNHSFIAASMSFNPFSMVHVGSVMSVVRRLNKTAPPDVIITDEAHHSCAGSWKKILGNYPKAWKIGVTASPVRLSGEPLGDIFDDMIIGPSVNELINLGFLTKYRIFAPSTIDVSGLKTRGGDYARDELMNRSMHVTGDAIVEYRKRALGKRAVVFCTTVEHATMVMHSFRAAGFVTACIDGTMATRDRANLVSDFRNGKIEVMTSVDIISEGFDLPAIECAIMLRPTKSLGLWIQQSGRALRLHPGKDHAIILDHAGNTEFHGLPCDDREWSLKGTLPRSKAPNKCGSCYGYQSDPLARVCEFCGAILKVVAFRDGKERELPEVVEGDLVEIDPSIARRARAKEQGAAQSYEELVELGRARGYKSAERWAAHLMEARGKKFASNKSR